MTDREKLIANIDDCRTYVAKKEELADHLISNGVTFTPAIPGPTTEDPNIMELCFRNGENHMRDKIKTSLLKLSADMPCVTISQVIKILEDLQ